MTTTFWILAAAMALAALGFVAWPLLRQRPIAMGLDPALQAKREALEQARRAGALTAKEVRTKLAALEARPAATGSSRLLPIVLVVLLPVAAILLYRTLGEPRALDPVWQGAIAAAAGSGAVADTAAPPPDMDRAVAGLAERLKNEPDDLEGWMLLGRAYKTMERFELAREALANAFRLAPDNPDVMIEYAEAQVLASSSRRFTGEPLALLQRAVLAQPQSQRGLWLLGIASYQENDFAAAAVTWERLLAVLPNDAEPRAQLLERIADARQKAGMPPLPATATVAAAAAQTPQQAPSTNPTATATASSEGPRLTVTVDITPELKAKVGASDVLFVFARAAQGPRMPLAIQRLPATSLPVTITLDDSTSMMPAMKLSTMPQVVVGARISKSGQATPQPGDFQTLSEPIANTHSEPLRLVIDEVVP